MVDKFLIDRSLIEQEVNFICCALKSFYASAEAVERNLDSFTTNLVVADSDRRYGNSI